MNEIWVLARTGYGRTIVLGAFATWSDLLDYLHEQGLEELLEQPPRLHSDQYYGSIEIGPFTYVVERVSFRGKPPPAEPTLLCGTPRAEKWVPATS